MDVDAIKSVRLVCAEIQGLKKLHVKITLPESGVFAIRGKEAAGKSSAVDAFWYHLVGGQISREVIARGQDKALMICEHETDLGPVISRMVITEKSGRRIEAYPKGQKNAKFSSAGELLKAWYGSVFLDLVGWVNLSETPEGCRKQMEMAWELLPAETRQALHRYKQQYQEAYAERTKANARVEEAKRQLNEQESVYQSRWGQTKPPARRIETSQALLALGGIEILEGERRQARERISKVNATIHDLEDRLAKLKKQRTQLEKVIEKLDKPLQPKDVLKRARQESDTERINQFQGLYERLEETGVIVIDELSMRLKAEIGGASEVNEQYGAAIRLREARDRAEKSVVDQANVVQLMTDAQEGIRRIQASAEWPIEGLGFAKAGLTKDGLPFTREHISESEMYEIAADVLIEHHERRRNLGEVLSHPLLLCREASGIGEETLERINQKLRKRNGLLILGKSGTREGPVGLILEEGRAREKED